MLLSKKSTRNVPRVYRCPNAAAASYVHDYNISDIARKLGKSATTLSNKLNENIDSHVLALAEAHAIQLITMDFRVLEAMALDLGKVVFDLPDANEDLSEKGLIGLIFHLMEAQGDLAKSMRVAIESEFITSRDFSIMEKLAMESITSVLQMLAELREKVRGTPPTATQASLKVA